MMLRDERPGDEAAIRTLTAQAFAPMPFSNGSEPVIIDRLREADALTHSIIIEDEGTIIGHIAFSPVTLGGSAGRWFGLGPVSVATDRQGEGHGRALIEEGLAQLKAGGATGCVLIGNPDLYGRFGFVSSEHLHYGDLPRQFVQGL